MIPLYQFRAQRWSPRSLLAISAYENQGDRLECGFRRILHLRAALSSQLGSSDWASLGLPFLDHASVPFPRNIECAFPFPKIVSQSASPDSSFEVGAVELMEYVHSRATHLDVQQQQFPRTLLPALYALMRIGLYYQPLPRSQGADALIRCTEDVICNFQFKNSSKPLSDADVESEARNCGPVESSKWKSFLILVPSGGHSVNGGDDAIIHHGNVCVVLLSRAVRGALFRFARSALDRAREQAGV